MPNGELLGRLRAEGLLTVGAADNVLRLLPPLIIDHSHVDEALAALERVAKAWTDFPADTKAAS